MVEEDSVEETELKAKDAALVVDVGEETEATEEVVDVVTVVLLDAEARRRKEPGFPLPNLVAW